MYRSHNRSKGGGAERVVRESEGVMAVNIGAYHPHVIKEPIETENTPGGSTVKTNTNSIKTGPMSFPPKLLFNLTVPSHQIALCFIPLFLYCTEKLIYWVMASPP
jgi:hypothetical protein